MFSSLHLCVAQPMAFFPLSKSRLDTLSVLIIGMINARTVNLGRKKRLALDLTNWKLGRTDINILVLAIVTRRFRMPIFWFFLPHRGNSETAHRIAMAWIYACALDLMGLKNIKRKSHKRSQKS